jgi:hypothetical protein
MGIPGFLVVGFVTVWKEGGREDGFMSGIE